LGFRAVVWVQEDPLGARLPEQVDLRVPSVGEKGSAGRAGARPTRVDEKVVIGTKPTRRMTEHPQALPAVTVATPVGIRLQDRLGEI
jgi:hypothetical protein